MAKKTSKTSKTSKGLEFGSPEWRKKYGLHGKKKGGKGTGRKGRGK